MPADGRGPYLEIPEQNLLHRMVECADLTDDELTDFVELIRRAFNGGASWFHYGVDPIDHLRWKGIDGPYRSRASLKHTLDGGDGKPVGVSLVQYQDYLVNGQPRAVVVGTDAALDPSVQGRGIQSSMNRLSDITDQQYRDVGFSVGWGVVHPIWDHLAEVNPKPGRYPLANRLITYAKPLKWSGLRRRRPSRPRQAGASRTRDEIRGYRRKVGVRQVLRLLTAQFRVAAHSLGAAAQRRIPVPRRQPPDWRIESVARFGSEADDFWEDASRQFDFIQVRNREYLNWRYCDRRAGPFEVRVATSGDRMLGFAVIRADQQEAVLADLLALPGRSDVAEGLLDDAIALAHEAGSPTMRLWLQEHHPYARAVRRRGFFDTDQRLAMMIRRMWQSAPDLPFADDPRARVHATIADSDHV